MSRKRERPYLSRRDPCTFPKRRRPLPIQPEPINDSAAAKKPATVAIMGLPSDCSVLDVKSRFEIYGTISRTRLDPNGLAYITFRSPEAAQSSVSAAADPSFPITLLSKPVQVMWASDSVPQWKEGLAKKEGASSSALSSKLLRPEVPLSRRGRGNKLSSAIVNPRDGNKKGDDVGKDFSNGNTVEVREEDDLGAIKPFMGREIVAYDDIL